MINLFALRATKPEDLLAHEEPVGEKNDFYIQHNCEGAAIIVAAWGTHGKHMQRDVQVMAITPQLRCLGLNANGTPKHPLYIAANTHPTFLTKLPDVDVLA